MLCFKGKVPTTITIYVDTFTRQIVVEILGDNPSKLLEIRNREILLNESCVEKKLKQN